ncbi:hypothetical protein [Furfurilactobacillus entadae]|uniref:hypothetical protein n=1 Tax=Furfurilactobacillus entadae TaxID=2922307 RepID=UPI0035E8D70A
MGEPVIEQNRQFLIRLCLLVQSGIGLAGRRQVWAYLQTHHNEHLTLQSLFEIVTCSAEQQAQIMNQWQGRALADRVQHHLQTCKVTTILDDDYPRYLRELYAGTTGVV